MSTEQRIMSLANCVLFAAMLTTTPVIAAEKRCGWLDNPTPANWWLIDRDGEWVISIQGGDREGMYLDDSSWDNLPEIDKRKGKFVKTNNEYGYSCVCLYVITNQDQKKIIKIIGGKQLPLKPCKAIKKP